MVKKKDEQNVEAVTDSPKPEPTTNKKAQSQNDEQLIYCGPNLLGGRIMKYTVFRGGIPVYLNDLLEELPDIRELIVPISKLTDVQAKTLKQGTREYQLYNDISKFNEKGAK